MDNSDVSLTASPVQATESAAPIRELTGADLTLIGGGHGGPVVVVDPGPEGP